MSYFQNLSRAQLVWLIGTLLAGAGIVALGWVLEPQAENTLAIRPTTDMAIREIAPYLDTTGKSLAKELELPLDASMKTPVSDLGVSQEALDHAVTHLASHRGRSVKYFVFAALVLWGLVFLNRLGRPDRSPQSAFRTWYPRAPYVASLLLAVNRQFESPSILITVVAALALSFAVYRPFCQFVCPFGFVSWLAERVSLTRVRVDRQRCNQCGSCVRACPLEAAKHKVAGKLWEADCYSCARCLNVCPSGAIAYQPAWGSTPGNLVQVNQDSAPSDAGRTK